MLLNKNQLSSFDDVVKKEYLLTNGLGGFSSSTIAGLNIRKYHGLLNAALEPPINRQLLFSKLDETLHLSGKDYILASNEFKEGMGEGFHFLKTFDSHPLPQFTYEVEDVIINKSLSMEHGKNTIAIKYSIKTKTVGGMITFIPYVNSRDHHDVSSIGDFSYHQTYKDSILYLNEANSKFTLKIKGGCPYKPTEKWSLPFFYRNEAERGLPSIDYHYIPGLWQLELEADTVYNIDFVASIEEYPNFNSDSIFKNEIERRNNLLLRAGLTHPILKELVIASDQFLVKRKSTNGKSLIAGYPWFTDWGRDSMIALPGLTLSTGRYNDAKEILMSFVRYIKNGLIPNMFPDENTEPLYNTVDGTLWFFNAVYLYFKETGDITTIKEIIYPHMKDIIKHHVEGTLYDIYMDSDGLLTAGGPGTQLTWMDVKIDGKVMTPRHGKPVEVNALWYNALKIMVEFSCILKEDGSFYNQLSERTKNSFLKSFWKEDLKILYDVIQDDIPIHKVRPNQIIAVSLPFSMLDAEKSKYVFETVKKYLYTPYGLRSLAQTDSQYIGIYIGDVYNRDRCYHQGTVWGWLMGPYMDAYLKVNGNTKKTRREAMKLMEKFIDHMMDACLGTISEIFDGDFPHFPRGCCSQAWSVAEVLRVMKNLHNEE